MKPMAGLCLLLISVLLPGLALGDTELNFGLGFTSPVGDLADEVNPSLVFGAGLGLDMAPKFTIGAEIWNHAFSPTPAFEDVLDDVGILAMAVTAKIRFAPSAETAYVKFLIGGYRTKATMLVGEINVSGSETNPGFGVGFGYQFFGNSPHGGFVEGVFQQINNNAETASFMDFRGGLCLRFP